MLPILPITMNKEDVRVEANICHLIAFKITEAYHNYEIADQMQIRKPNVLLASSKLGAQEELRDKDTKWPNLILQPFQRGRQTK